MNSGSKDNESVIESPHEINGTLDTDLVNEEPNYAFCSSIPDNAHIDIYDFHELTKKISSLFYLFFPVTVESITALEMILSHMKQRFGTLLKVQERNRTSDLACPADVKEKPMYWGMPGLGKVWGNFLFHQNEKK